jgi:hypothetical protein
MLPVVVGSNAASVEDRLTTFRDDGSRDISAHWRRGRAGSKLAMVN